MYPRDLGPEALTDLELAPEEMSRGGSAILSPLGDYLAGPLYGREGIIYADLDPDALAGARFDFDPIGHYARPDVFSFAVDERAQRG
jgi:nitrilase